MELWDGIVGYSYNNNDNPCIISESYNKASISRTVDGSEYREDVGYIGGIVGMLNFEGSEISSCYNAGIIEATGSWTGGITSGVARRAKVKNCYNRGNILQQYNARWACAGGIAGNTFQPSNYGTKAIEVTNCYNLGTVEAKGNTKKLYVRWSIRTNTSWIYKY